MASHFALFADLENCGGKKSVLMDVIERVKIRGDILIGKVYGYTDSYSDLKETLLSNTFAVVPSLRFGKNQKNSMLGFRLFKCSMPACSFLQIQKGALPGAP